MLTRYELLSYCNQLLHIDAFKDYCPNGLQVEGSHEVRRILTGVTASQAMIEEAIKRQADTLIVHHGYFWRDEDPIVCGMKRKRLGLLLAHNINLIGYHLPLDAHPLYGNNAGLGEALGFDQPQAVKDFEPKDLLWMSNLSESISPVSLSERLEQVLKRKPLHIDAKTPSIQRVMWCTGGAQQFIDAAAMRSADAYISGEISEQTTHIARERGVHYFAAGHHATETWGVMALARHLNEVFSLPVEFVDCFNPA